ncbi:unnamed protein product [Rotaria magnacalcarata]|uniref:Uncharacterized protein n=2 Tax=Rotaria magnacalcarata TaxID=392030 RepID=A0A815WQZ2_9BILA|nr:unnamed protein product [Rotaria magnacalcarata]CAF1543981.1 unnamed protein product [Rotaria magnacalcarata]CAF2163209.1 unnamed protein product [Rotaria magnacalcarata]CAF2178761.1 unnamed protein product [Rotaria magnacalcarata]
MVDPLIRNCWILLLLLNVAKLALLQATITRAPFSLSRAVFLPPDPRVNPFFDHSIDGLADVQIGRSVKANNQTGAGELFRQETDQQIITQTGIDYPWQQLVSAGPMAINILGQLIVISSKTDFSFRDSSQNYKFKYMRHPQSFRATLIQIANDGYDAFSQAHSSMNQIQIYMSLIPGHVKTSLRILVSASPRLLERLLVPSLSNIDRIGRECSRLASNTHDQFVNVMQLLGEVIEVTTLAQGIHVQKLKDVEIELNISRVMEKQQQQIIETIQKHYNEAQASVREAQTAYTKALNDLPTGWNKILQNFVQAIIDVARDVAPVLITGGVSLVTGQKIQGPQGAGGQGSGGTRSIGEKIASGQALSAANMLFSQLTSMQKTFEESNTTDLRVLAKDFGNYRIVFNTAKDLVKGDGELSQKVGGLLRSAIDLTNLEDVEKIKSTLHGLISELKPLVAANAKGSDQAPKLDLSPETLSQPAPSRGKQDNEQFKVTMTLDRLKQAEQRYDQIFSQLLEQQKEMKALMVKIAGLDMAKIRFEELIELMRQAILLLGNIRQQWGRLVQFFSEISIRTRIATNETLAPFVNRMKEVASIQDITQSERMLYVDLLKEQAVGIHRHTYILYVMAHTYVDISNEFMMDKLSGLATMLTMQTDSEREQALRKLEKDTNTAQAKVEAIANERKRTFEAALMKRKNDLQKYLDNLGGASKEDLNAIKQADDLLKLT